MISSIDITTNEINTMYTPDDFHMDKALPSTLWHGTCETKPLPIGTKVKYHNTSVSNESYDGIIVGHIKNHKGVNSIIAFHHYQTSKDKGQLKKYTDTYSEWINNNVKRGLNFTLLTEDSLHKNFGISTYLYDFKSTVNQNLTPISKQFSLDELTNQLSKQVDSNKS